MRRQVGPDGVQEPRVLLLSERSREAVPVKEIGRVRSFVFNEAKPFMLVRSRLQGCQHTRDAQRRNAVLHLE
jgi:hypothetical protein